MRRVKAGVDDLLELWVRRSNGVEDLVTISFERDCGATVMVVENIDTKLKLELR